jgi:hypothetical protein
VVKEIYKDVQTSLNVTALGLQTLRQSFDSLEKQAEKYEPPKPLPEDSSHFSVLENAQSRRYVSDIIETWSPQVGAIERELQLWQKPRFSTDPRDHWTQNRILPYIFSWRKLKANFTLWICSEGQGRQAWMTEFSLDLIRVCRSQGQLVTFALCDRPNNVRWTPQILIKQMICQLLHQNPRLAIQEPEIFDLRALRQAKTSKTTFRILKAIVPRLENLLIIIDRLELC